MITIQVNGEAHPVPDGATLASLLAALGLEGHPVAVEHNRQVVRRAAQSHQPLAAGDRVEIVTLVGGG